MPSARELIATGRSTEEVAVAIGADRVIYQDLEDLVEAAREGNPRITRFDTSCFDGVYVTGDVDKTYLEHVEHMRGDAAKCASPMNDLVSTELHTYY
jgi:amidophosphoribosyltransferase